MLIDNVSGNYRFLTGIAPYSCGVVAMPGFEIVHATLQRPPTYELGFELIERHLEASGRPRQALCGIELRLPAPVSFEGFAAFNHEYQEILSQWGLMVEGRNPIARTNIAPVVRPPEQPSLYAFSYTVPSEADSPSFVVAGAGDLDDQTNLSTAAIVRPNETSEEALREKARTVMDVMQSRLDGLNVGWSTVTAMDVYTTHPVQPFLLDTMLGPAGDAAVHGIRWHFGHPPIKGLAFEMDVRGVRQEVRIMVDG
jgi:hypothetical protein